MPSTYKLESIAILKKSNKPMGASELIKEIKKRGGFKY